MLPILKRTRFTHLITNKCILLGTYIRKISSSLKDCLLTSKDFKIMEYKETYILNFFFGEVLSAPIKFRFSFPELKDFNNNISEIIFEIYNDDHYFPVEKEFLEFNTVAKKQEIGHNFNACAQTGIVKVNYNSFKSDNSYAYTEHVGMFIQHFLSYLLTFFQRRRIIIGVPRLTSGDKFILSMPPFFAGEFIDSIGYGEPLISYKDTQNCLNSAVDKYSRMSEDERKHIRMLLVRYNETLNLPYSYERIEAYWRIIEALGDSKLMNDAQQKEYNRIRNVIGMQKESGNLKSFIIALSDYNLSYTDDEIVNSFNFRNKTIHEYLNPDILNDTSISNIFRFLNKSTEKILLSSLNIDIKYYREGGYTLIANRVL